MLVKILVYNIVDQKVKGFCSLGRGSIVTLCIYSHEVIGPSGQKSDRAGFFPKILVAVETGPKGQNWPENRVFVKYLKNTSLDFFDFMHDVRP